MAPDKMAAVLRATNQVFLRVIYKLILYIMFLPTVSNGQKIASGYQDRDHSPRIRLRASGYQDSDHYLRLEEELLDIRTAITHLGLDRDCFLQQGRCTGHSPNTTQGQHHRYLQEEGRRYRGQKAGCLVRTRRRRVGKLPLPSILLANVQSLDNK